MRGIGGGGGLSNSAPCSLAGRPEALDGQPQHRRPERAARSRRTDSASQMRSGSRERLAEDHALAPAAARDQARGERGGAQRAPAALGAGQQPVHEHAQHALQRLAGARVADLHRLLQALLARGARRSGLSSPQASRWASAPGAPKRSAERRAPEPRQLAERAHAQAARAARPAPPCPARKPSSSTGRPASQRRACLAVEHQRTARAHRQRGRQRAEARRARPRCAPGRAERAAGGGDRRLQRAVDPAQPVRSRSRRARDAAGSTAAPIDFQRAHRRLPRLRHQHGVARHEHQLGAAGERLAEDHPARHAAGLRRSRDLPHALFGRRPAAPPPARAPPASGGRSSTPRRRPRPARSGGCRRRRPYERMFASAAADRQLARRRAQRAGAGSSSSIHRQRPLGGPAEELAHERVLRGEHRARRRPLRRSARATAPRCIRRSGAPRRCCG